MMRRRDLLAGGALAAGSVALGTLGIVGALSSERVDAAPQATGPAPATRPSVDFQAGMSLAHLHLPNRGYGSETCAVQLRRLADLGVTHVALTPFAYLAALDAVSLRYGSSMDPTMTDAHLRAAARQAADVGIRVMIKPHVWSNAFWGGSASRQDVDPGDRWEEWFEAYAGFALHYATLAEQVGAEVFCVGLEFLKATELNPGAWGAIAQRCRGVFGGALTYGANWWREAEIFADWSDFDFVGVNAYAPLTQAADPDVAALTAGWGRWFDEIGAVASLASRPLLLTEVGIRRVTGAAARPWDQSLEGTPDEDLQARTYEALLGAVAERSWIRGLYLWKWFTAVGVARDDYCPADRAAEDVIRSRWTSGPPG